MTYAELDRLSRDFAAFLQGLPGMAKGERVAIMAPNLLQYPVALFGILRAGMTVVNVNPLYTPRELEHQLKDSGAKAIVIVENFASVLQQVLGNTPVEHVITTQLGDLLPGAEALDRQLGHQEGEEDGAGVAHRRRHRVPGGARARRGGAARAGRGDARGHRVPAVHRRHHRRFERRDAHPPQHPRQHRADGRRGSRAASRKAPKS